MLSVFSELSMSFVSLIEFRPRVPQIFFRAAKRSIDSTSECIKAAVLITLCEMFLYHGCKSVLQGWARSGDGSRHSVHTGHALGSLWSCYRPSTCEIDLRCPLQQHTRMGHRPPACAMIGGAR